MRWVLLFDEQAQSPIGPVDVHCGIIREAGGHSQGVTQFVGGFFTHETGARETIVQVEFVQAANRNPFSLF